MEEDSTAAVDVVMKYATYEEFLDSQVTRLDLSYLEDEELARQLVELGYRGSGEVIKREEFYSRKAAAEQLLLSRRIQAPKLASANKEITEPLLRELADTEEANRTGKMTTIIFIRDRNSRQQEISGYIDYAHRLKSEDFEVYFAGKKKLLPRPSDLSYYNWENQTCCSNNTPNFQLITNHLEGLLFKSKRDRKIIVVDPKAQSYGDNTTRKEIKSDKYIQVIAYRHSTRRKT
ncbi:unnamed protein product [Rotaria magnacalcarata]|uniref:Cilia- and flagella-associated protein 299 n=2 Tax=Rotaria magnacalcarata TaxID=392030 RepID=A0A816S2E9_9BILA|nr:unnamed protein product [Rotaria magnacalcarata]CAF1301933.1 unnamed protein product [Rotaria magnacalcarata]CAF2079749.1 unnamed protein product [Rotaria magnacalcarata]CAF4429741.1 unnamed protein product [Rotaria magnacalcarata]